MLLRRITEHVKDQNWFAVAIDFGIVVFGVFIGIQVANWNEYRAESLRESFYLGALREDFQSVIAELENDIAVFETISDSMTLLLEQSRSESPDVSLAELNDAASLLVRMEGTMLASATYLNLTGSGDLAIIQNQELKKAMSSFFARADLIALVSNTHEMQLVNIFQPYVIHNLDYVMTLRRDRGAPLSKAFETDRILTKLRTPEFRNVVAVKWDTVTDLRNVFQFALLDARAIEALIALETSENQ